MIIRNSAIGCLLTLISFSASAGDVTALCPGCNPRNANDALTISTAIDYANSGLNGLSQGDTVDIEHDQKQPNGNLFETIRTYSIIRLPAHSAADLADLGFTADVNDIGRHIKPPGYGGFGITYYDNATACFFSFEFC
jgi:hypothetical protein